MGDPRVQERDNPLVRRLNAVAEVNREAGFALGGGTRPPRPTPNGPVQGGSATVLPPPAIPLSPEEALGDALPPAEVAELERRWAEDPTNPANKAKALMGPAPEGPFPPIVPAVNRFIPTPEPPIHKLNYVSLVEALPLTDEQKQQVKMWVFQGAAQEVMRQAAAQLDAMQVAFGLAPKEEPGGNMEEQGEKERLAESVGEKPEGQGVAVPTNTKRQRSRRKSKSQGNPAT